MIRYGFLVAASLAIFAVTIDAQQTPAASPNSKLTTVLADLAGTVAQESGAATTQRVGASAVSAADIMRTTSVKDAVQGRRLRIDANNEVQVYILVDAVTDAVQRQLTDAGVTIEIADVASRRIQAHLPVNRLTAVAQLGIVNAIRLPTYARPRIGATTTEGDSILASDAARAQLGLDGTGVRVGVISDGIKGIFEALCGTCTGATTGPMETGDLPTAIGTRNAAGVLTGISGGIVGRSFQANQDLEGLPPSTPACSFSGAGAEGTALLEIVHDVAPGAKLSFANGDTDLAFNQAVNFLAASNDVVLDDIGFYGEAYDGTSPVSLNTAAALNNPAWPIRAYFTSAGNAADEHYYGSYVDSGVDGTSIAGITNPGHLHLFQQTADTTDILGLGKQPYNLIVLPQNGEVAIFLTWNDPFGGSSNNYDLFLVQQSTGRVVASSVDVQNGKQDPSEVIDYVNRGSADRFLIVVQNVRGAAQPRNLNIFSFQPECASAGPTLLAAGRHERHNYNTATHSISAQSDAGGSPAGVVAVGAICSASSAASSSFPSDESCLDTGHTTAEFFSSRGPTIDGRMKPDIAAIDGVSVTGAGGFTPPFFGTSAASPHVGGIAALLLQSAPCLLNRATSTVAPGAARTTVRNLILGKADPMSPSPDNVFGFGRANALSSVNATLPQFNGVRTMTFDANTTFGASLTAAQLGFVDPNGCALPALNWTGGCGTGPGTTMTCPAGANALSVAASNNGVTYSGFVDLQVNITDFSVGASPDNATVKSGQSSRHVVTITPVSGAYNSPVTLSCSSGNLPPQTSCVFDPPTVTPGSKGAQSTLTITTTSAGSASTAPARTGTAGRFTTLASGIALFPTTVTFGSQTLNTTSPGQIVSLTNTGGDPMTITAITPAGDFAAVSNCGVTMASGASCSVSVTFTPTAAGVRNGTLTFVDNALGSPHVITLAGTGAAAPPATGGTPAGSYAVTVSGTAGTSVAHFGVVTLTVQ